MEKLTANIYTAPSVITIPGLFFTFFPPIQTKTKDKSGKRQWPLEKSIHQSVSFYSSSTPSQKQRALKILALHLTRADAPFNKGFDGVGQTKQKGGVFVSATLVRGQRIDAGGTSTDAKVLRQQTCFLSWSRSLWLCLRATGTQWSLLVELLISPYKLAWKREEKDL